MTSTTASSSASSSTSTSSSSLDALALLVEGVKDDDYEQVIASINRVVTVAVSIGPTRTRTDLLKFLTEFSEQDNDEAMTAIAKQLGDFVDLVGGPQYAVCLLPLLEKLCGEEEVVVRDAAVQSLQKIIPQLPKTDVLGKVLPMIKRLANGEWFTTRVSVCGLFGVTIAVVPDKEQAELRAMYTVLCNDETPMVRKSAFNNLGTMTVVTQKQFFKGDIYPIVKLLAQDDLDAMRLFSIDACAELSKKLDSSEFVTMILPILEALQDDPSWRVRQQLAKTMPRMCERASDSSEVGKKLLPVLVKLVKDKETEVRVWATRSLAPSAAIIKSGLLESIGPVLELLVNDGAQNVRVAVAAALVELCPLFGREPSMKLLVPLIQQLTKDEFHQVKASVVSKMELLAECLGPTNMTNTILPNLLELSHDAKWRVRKAVVDKMCLLAKSLGAKTFEKKLQPVVISCLSDHVYAIREKACMQVALIVEEFGGKWATEKFLPAAFALYDKSTNYLHRMTVLLLIQHCGSKCGPEITEKSLLPIALTACTDDVANVRIAACKTFKILLPLLDKNLVKSKVEPLMQKLTKDSDVDVVYFAQQTLNSISALSSASTSSSPSCSSTSSSSKS
eukprot:TRINITY_DN11847_c0_g1_i1.p1 TRINITY_DN11847_c0_g1~~TRINITY_DN11847_c0_g1_i1.p1  ORF type:complete len:619 (-),score=121.51 TRINITY_DN11847_c0_g1_i1:55-1911(-)